MWIRILDIFLSIYMICSRQMRIRLLSIKYRLLSNSISSRFQFYHLVNWKNPSCIQGLLPKNYQFSLCPSFVIGFEVYYPKTNSLVSCIICDKIHIHCIVFFIHLTFLQSYLSLFSYTTCIHFAKLDTQLDLKNRLINFWVLCILVYVIFSWCVNCWKMEIYIFWDMRDNECANISLLLRLIWVFKTLWRMKTHCMLDFFISLRSILYSLNWLCLECLHASIYGSYSVKFHILKERIFVFMCILNLFFKLGLCRFSFLHHLNVP